MTRRVQSRGAEVVYLRPPALNSRGKCVPSAAAVLPKRLSSSCYFSEVRKVALLPKTINGFRLSEAFSIDLAI